MPDTATHRKRNHVTYRRTPVLALLLSLLLAASVAALTPTAAVAQTTTGIPNAGAVVFQDDFTGAANASFDTTKWEDWSTCTYNATAAFGDYNAPIQCGDNEKLDGSGHLRIPASPTGGSAIRTKTFDAQYGVFSAWMKMPTQTGYWPAFWTLNDNRNGQTVHPYGEMDVMEYYSFQTGNYHGAGHTWGGTSEYHGPDNVCPNGWDTSAFNLTSAYHKYSAKIEPGKITWYFDDQLCGMQYHKDPSQVWGFGPDITRGNWPILDLAVGGAGGQNPKPTKAANLLVDRVEVRALADPNLTNGVVSGGTYEISNQCTGKLVQPDPAYPGGINQLQTWADKDQPFQRWVLTDRGNGYWKVANVGAPGKVADVNDASQADGTPIKLWDDTGSDAQQWDIEKNADGSYSLFARHSNKAMDVSDGLAADGTLVQQWTYDAGACAQRYVLTKI